MAKFCGKCGEKLDENTGLCQHCDNIIAGTAPNNDNTSTVSEKHNSDKPEKSKKKNLFKKVCIILIVTILIIIALVVTVCLLVYNDKFDIPFINNIFITTGLKESEPVPSDDKNGDDIIPDDEDEDNDDSDVVPDDNTDLGDNYVVPDFDADKFYNDNTELRSSFDAESSEDTVTEYEISDYYYERGFLDAPITYEFEIDGTYSGTHEASYYSSSKHPMYQTYYIAENGDMWLISTVNGSIFAHPYSYNARNDASSELIFISETDTITSYDNTTNKFYVNIPKEPKTTIITVERIDAATLEQLTREELN